jgi:hypothetical protein
MRSPGRHRHGLNASPGTTLSAWLAACVFCLCSLAARAQDGGTLKPATHGELWLSTTLSYKPFAKKGEKAKDSGPFYRKLPVIAELGWRNRLDPLANKMCYGTLGTKYKVFDFLKVGAEYRYTVNDRYDPNESRLSLPLWLEWNKDRVTFTHRFTYQHDFIPVTKVRTVLRNRLAVEYNIPHWKLDPHISAEAFSGLHYTGNSLVGMRYEFGTDVALDKKKDHTLDLAIRHDREINEDDPQYRWIFVVGYDLELKKKK